MYLGQWGPLVRVGLVVIDNLLLQFGQLGC